MTFTKNIICVKSQMTQKNKQLQILRIREPATEKLFCGHNGVEKLQYSLEE